MEENQLYYKIDFDKLQVETLQFVSLHPLLTNYAIFLTPSQQQIILFKTDLARLYNSEIEAHEELLNLLKKRLQTEEAFLQELMIK